MSKSHRRAKSLERQAREQRAWERNAADIEKDLPILVRVSLGKFTPVPVGVQISKGAPWHGLTLRRLQAFRRVAGSIGYRFAADITLYEHRYTHQTAWHMAMPANRRMGFLNRAGEVVVSFGNPQDTAAWLLREYQQRKDQSS